RTGPAIESARGRIDLEVEGIVLDGQQLCAVESAIPALRAAPWTGEPIEVDFRMGVRSRALLDGFYESEVWGTWTRTAQPTITLPAMVRGPVRMRIEACAFGANSGRPLRVVMGGGEVTFSVGRSRESVEVEIQV